MTSIGGPAHDGIMKRLASHRCSSCRPWRKSAGLLLIGAHVLEIGVDPALLIADRINALVVDAQQKVVHQFADCKAGLLDAGKTLLELVDLHVAFDDRIEVVDRMADIP